MTGPKRMGWVLGLTLPLALLLVLGTRGRIDAPTASPGPPENESSEQLLDSSPSSAKATDPRILLPREGNRGADGTATPPAALSGLQILASSERGPNHSDARVLDRGLPPSGRTVIGVTPPAPLDPRTLEKREARWQARRSRRNRLRLDRLVEEFGLDADDTARIQAAFENSVSSTRKLFSHLDPTNPDLELLSTGLSHIRSALRSDLQEVLGPARLALYEEWNRLGRFVLPEERRQRTR